MSAGWISVADSLPRATEPVLISCADGVWVARYLAEPYDLGDMWGEEDGYANEIGPGWFTWQGRFPEVVPMGGVSHWMSLPEAPKKVAQ